MPQKPPGFSPCGNTQPGGRRGFQSPHKATENIASFSPGRNCTSQVGLHPGPSSSVFQKAVLCQGTEKAALCQGTTSKPALSAAEGCRKMPQKPRALAPAGTLNPEGGWGFNPRIKPTKILRALAPERTLVRCTMAGCPMSGFSDMGDLEPQSLRVRARLQSCRKCHKNLRALAPAGTLNPEGGGGFNPRIKPTKTSRALAPAESAF
jgi:hypothetical protein